MAFPPATPWRQLVTTFLAVLVLFLAGSGAPTPVLGARDNKLQAGDGALLPTSSGRGELVLHQHEVSAEQVTALHTEKYHSDKTIRILKSFGEGS